MKAAAGKCERQCREGYGSISGQKWQLGHKLLILGLEYYLWDTECHVGDLGEAEAGGS